MSWDTPRHHAEEETISHRASSLSRLLRYAAALTGQFSLMAGSLTAVDAAAARLLPAGVLPAPAVGALFAFLSLRSRVFSCLDNSRPNRAAQKGKATPPDVKRPSWTPPGIAFPFIWTTITALRGAASAMVYSTLGGDARLMCAPLLAMCLHLAVGDVWNTVTNVERRLGVSAAGCPLVLGSVLLAVAQYATVSRAAALVIAPSAVWISIACVLTGAIWNLNTPRQPLFPPRGDGKGTAFRLQMLGQLQPTSIGGSD